MMELNKPEFKVGLTFPMAISNFRTETKKKLEKSLKEIIIAENNYEEQANKGTLNNIIVNDLKNTYATIDQFVKVYTQKFAKKDHPARGYYDSIMIIPKASRCPYCGQRDVSTLDHYLDKQKYPKFTVTPYNLVPSCDKCNRIKLSDSPLNQGEYYVHPYYDQVDQYKWLKARVVYMRPLIVEFCVECDCEIETNTRNRIRYHFEKLELNKLYMAEATNELYNKKFRLVKLFSERGPESVRDYLKDEYDSYEKNSINSWQTAMFKALSEEEKFYNYILDWF